MRTKLSSRRTKFWVLGGPPFPLGRCRSAATPVLDHCEGSLQEGGPGAGLRRCQKPPGRGPVAWAGSAAAHPPRRPTQLQESMQRKSARAARASQCHQLSLVWHGLVGPDRPVAPQARDLPLRTAPPAGTGNSTLTAHTDAPSAAPSACAAPCLSEWVDLSIKRPSAVQSRWF